MAESGAAGQDSRTALAWCFEHCTKAEHGQARRNLQDLADAFGFEFVREKKCAGLLRWLESRPGTVLLVAEWREAKPIMEQLGNMSIACNISMCVVARTSKIFRRVSAWAEQQSAEQEILVSEGFSLRRVEELVARHLDRVPWLLRKNVHSLLL